MPCLITNRSNSPLTLPSPLRGVLAPGQKIAVNYSAQQIIDAFNDVVPPDQLAVSETTQTTNFDAEFASVITDVLVHEESVVWF